MMALYKGFKILINQDDEDETFYFFIVESAYSEYGFITEADAEVAAKEYINSNCSGDLVGNKISIQFKLNGNYNGEIGEHKSVAFFSHRDGEDLIADANTFIAELNEKVPKAGGTPLERREPNTVMLHFIIWLNNLHGILFQEQGNYYLGKDTYDGDNSDNGNIIIDL